MCRKMILLLSCVLAIGCVAHATVVDDFTDDALNSNWTEVLLLSRGGGCDYDTTTNDNQLTLTSTSAVAEQRGLLRDDYSLSIGETLIVDLVSAENFAGGIMVATGTDVGIGSYDPGGDYTQQDRQDYLTISYSASAGNVVSEFFNGSTDGGQVASSVALSLVSRLWIERVSTNEFNAGWIEIDDSVHDLRTVTFTSGNAPGDAVGFYSDLRAVDAAVVFDNLEVIPEPATMVLLSLGGLLIRRKKA